MTEIRTRFAPSPTGHLHIGGARTALFNWLLARGSHGKFVLRIEDTDAQRSTEEFTRSILEAMEWLGLDWDEGPFFQKERTELHIAQVQRLLDSGRAYWCHCQPDDLAERKQRALAEGRKPKYDGRCRHLGLGPAPGAVVRFKGPESGLTSWNDLIKGPIAIDNSELDDLIILRSDGLPTYNFAVVVDDVTMGITQIIRGDDHVNNTPRQILLYDALEAPKPEFGHVPMILGADKTRLSKRHGATSVLAYRDLGYLPEALVNYLVRLGWSHGDEEIFSKEDLIRKFSLDNVGRSAGVFNPEKLDWLNQHYIKESSPERMAELTGPMIERDLGIAPDRDYLAKALVALQPRSKTVVDLAEQVQFYLIPDDQLEFDPKARKKFFLPALVPAMTDLVQGLAGLDTFSEETIERIFHEVSQKHDVKLGKIAQPARLGLTGRTASPGIFEVIDVLGPERSLKRLRRALTLMDSPGS